MILFYLQVLLPNLEDLTLRKDYDELPEVSSNSTSSSIRCSRNPKYLFTSSFIQNHSKLKELRVGGWEFMEGIVLTEEERMYMEFPNLNFLSLSHLPKLSRFCDGQRVKFCSLTELLIEECPALKTFVGSHPTTDITVSKEENNHQSNIPPLFDNKVIFFFFPIIFLFFYIY